MSLGPKFGDSPEPDKSFLVIHPDYIEKSREIFKDLKLNIISGKKCFGRFYWKLWWHWTMVEQSNASCLCCYDKTTSNGMAMYSKSDEKTWDQLHSTQSLKIFFMIYLALRLPKISLTFFVVPCNMVELVFMIQKSSTHTLFLIKKQQNVYQNPFMMAQS